MPVAPRIVNDVSYVMCINHEIHFAWQAQYLVRLEGVTVAPRIVNDVSNVMCINQIQFACRRSGEVHVSLFRCSIW